jgi:hypothetical protein
MKSFKYPIVDRPLRVSEGATRAGEIAFGRPAGLNLRKGLPLSDDKKKGTLRGNANPQNPCER